MTTDLDNAVRSSLADIVATAPHPDEQPSRLVTIDSGTPSRRPYVAVAASLILVAGIAALVYAGSRDPSSVARNSAADAPPVAPPAIAGDEPLVTDTSEPSATIVPVDPSSPVGVTGQRIGDVPASGSPSWMTDGEIDPDNLPAWGTIASEGRIVGYVKPFDLLLGESDDITIYGEDGEPIGAFVDGKPVIVPDAAP